MTSVNSVFLFKCPNNPWFINKLCNLKQGDLSDEDCLLLMRVLSLSYYSSVQQRELVGS